MDHHRSQALAQALAQVEEQVQERVGPSKMHASSVSASMPTNRLTDNRVGSHTRTHLLQTLPRFHRQGLILPVEEGWAEVVAVAV